MTHRIETLAVHAGNEPEPRTGAVSVPIYQTSTFAQTAPNEHAGWDYSRAGNPTRDALQVNLAALEGGKHGFSFGSGCAATDAIMHCLSAGDHVVAGDDLYGGTFRLFDKVYRRHGIEFSYVPSGDSKAYAEAMQDNTKLVWLETPTNPLLGVANIAEVCEAAKKRNVPVAVDNTFATPYLQRPLDHGADMVVHSVTKYLGGHADVVGGAVIVNDDDWAERIFFIQKSVGGVSGPFDAFLTLRGTKTLAVRMDRHCDNAEGLLGMLEEHKKVTKVIYPGLASHPNHAVAKQQMKRFGGMISFVVDGGLEAAQTLLQSTKVFTLAESLGGVESLIELPSLMTHASIPKKMREARGVDDALIRISVGIEHVDDLKDDLRSALDQI